MGRSPRIQALAPPGELEIVAGRIDEGVALVREGRIAWANPRLADLAAWPDPAELVGQRVADWLEGGLDGSDGVTSAVEGAGAPCLLRSRSGRVVSRVRALRLGRVGGEDGENEVWMFEAWPLESDEASAAEAVGELNHELESLRQEATARSRERDELIAHLGHELRTPLTIISGYGNLLLSGRVGELSDEQRRCLEESRVGCDRLNSFVGHLLESSWGYADGLALERRPGSLLDSIQDVVSFLAPLLEQRQLSVAVDVDDSLPELSLDFPRIEQVLTNLLENAVKYTKSSSTIDLSVRVVTTTDEEPASVTQGVASHGDRGQGGSSGQVRKWVEVAIVDDGPGIALEDRERIFDAYVRTESARIDDAAEVSTSPVSDGVGLGLAICRRIVEAHDGKITVNDAPGRGSRFAFSVPLIGSGRGGER